MRKISFGIKVTLAVVLCASMGMASRYTFARKQSGQRIQPIRQRNDLPVTTYQPENARVVLASGAAGQLEFRRSHRYNSTFEISSPEWSKAKITDASKSVCDLPLLALNTGSLPLNRTDIIMIGRVAGAQALLSADHTNIFSQFTVEIERAVKDISGLLIAGRSITIERHGGAVIFPSGARVERGGCYNRMPTVNQTYLFFLKYQLQTDDFKILTAFEIRNGRVFALDGTNSATDENLTEFKRFDGLTTEALLTEIEQNGETR
jgi:hypothetical protein